MSEKVRIINGSGHVKYITKKIADNARLMNEYGWIVQDFKQEEELEESESSFEGTTTININESDLIGTPSEEPIKVSDNYKITNSADVDLFELNNESDKEVNKGKRKNK